METSYLAYIIGAKFEQKHSKISRDILDFVIYFCTKLFATSLVFFNEGRYFRNENASTVFDTLKGFSNEHTYFLLHKEFKR